MRIGQGGVNVRPGSRPEARIKETVNVVIAIITDRKMQARGSAVLHNPKSRIRRRSGLYVTRERARDGGDLRIINSRSRLVTQVLGLNGQLQTATRALLDPGVDETLYLPSSIRHHLLPRGQRGNFARLKTCSRLSQGSLVQRPPAPTAKSNRV